VWLVDPDVTVMSEYPELFEKMDRLDREMDVQAALIESLTDKVDGLVQVVLKLGLRVDASRSKNKKGNPNVAINAVSP